MWATLFGVVRKRPLRNPEDRILLLAGFLLGYAIPPRPDDLLSHLTDAYSWHFLDLLPGVGVNGALGWQCPVDLEGGRRGAPEANS